MSPSDEMLEIPAVTTPRDAGGPRRDWLAPAIIGCALVLQMMSSTVVVNALPAMAQSFDVEPLRLNVAITVYMLSAAVFLPLSAWMADRFGARRVFLLSIGFFALGSVICGLSQTLTQLVIGRIVQGAAGAALWPVGRLILLRVTPKTELVGALSIMTMPPMLGPILGPVLGGALVTFANWRWIFFIDVPIALLGIYLVLRHIPEVRETTPPRLDMRGIILTGVGLAALIFGFENIGRSTLGPWMVVGLFAVGLGALAIYGWHAKRTPYAVVDPSVFRKQTYSASVIGGGFVRVAIGAQPFLLAMLLQVGFGMSAFAAGSLTFIGAIGALLMKSVAPPLLRRYGFRTVLLVNAALVCTTLVIDSLFRPGWPHWAIMAVLAFDGFSRSLQFTALNALAYDEIEPHELSRASTTISMSQQLTQSIGVGLAASTLHVFMNFKGQTQLSVEVISPAFIIIGVLTLFSTIWFAMLPKDAGDAMNGRAGS
jgi:EmrB/QacA subfamily drug resistance transporter